MDKLKDLIAEEEKVFRIQERFMRNFAIHIRGLRDEHIEPLIQSHLRDCIEYFKKYGTTKGKNSPWIIKNREVHYGKENR